jgi:Subtilisin inhibitor-like
VDRRKARQPVGPLGRGALLLGLLVAAGCGSATGGGDAAEPPPKPRFDLQITYWPEGKGGESRTAALTCDPNGGTHPDAAAACAALDAHPEALHPVPGDMACTEIYGGDQVALVEGEGMRAILNRTNGCEIARWDALAPVIELSA